MADLATTIATTSVPPGKLAVFWLGGAGFVFRTAGGRTVCIDPYLSDSLDHYYGWKRLPLSPIPLRPDRLKVDLVLTTHAHEDHLDPGTIPELARSSGVPVAGPTQCVAQMRQWGLPEDQVIEINRGERRLLAGVDVAAVFAHHVSPAGAKTPDAVGYVLNLDGVVVYHTGDSLYHPDLLALRDAGVRPHLLLVCINGGYGNMGPAEAARLTCEMAPSAVVPMHWGLVGENTSDPAEFVAALVATGSKARPVVMLPGDVYISSFTVV